MTEAIKPRDPNLYVTVAMLKRGNGRDSSAATEGVFSDPDAFEAACREAAYIIDTMTDCSDVEQRAAEVGFQAIRTQLDLERLQDQLRPR